jgi:branched-subunit amino acid ABC-type transport system permease component
MPGVREVLVTAGLSFAAMAFLFGALALWVAASAARNQTGGPVTLRLTAAAACALAGVVLFGLAVRRVHRRFRPDSTE